MEHNEKNLYQQIVFVILLFYFRGEDSLKEYLEVKTVTIKMPYKI
jgi:hypothetical protein